MYLIIWQISIESPAKKIAVAVAVATVAPLRQLLFATLLSIQKKDWNIILLTRVPTEQVQAAAKTDAKNCLF